MWRRFNRRCIALTASMAIWVIMSSMLLNGCAGLPATRIDQCAQEHGFERRMIKGSAFSHIVYLSHTLQESNVLHVYLEGDGTPWLLRFFVASDPTPRNPVMLRLMAIDGSPSVYLGRPCYHGLAAQPPCSPAHWTHGRYSKEVLDSMAAALERLVEPLGITGLIFFGHSGGGAMAMLLAERFAQTRAVVTLAGNLDPDAWTKHHGFSPLFTSLNPARRTPLDKKIIQLHFLGERDRNIPPSLSYAALAQQPQAQIRLVPDFNHSCCWQRIWPKVLESMPID